MATELRNSEISVLYGESARMDALDGAPRPALIEEVRKAQMDVEKAAERIHDPSPEAMARRTPFVLERLAGIKADFGQEHPFYLRNLKNAQDGGYLPKEVFKPASARFRTMNDIPRTAVPA